MDRDDLVERLEAGEWLGPGPVAVLLGVHRKTVHNMLADGRLQWRWHAGGRIRVINPASVRKFLALPGEVHRGRTERIEPAVTPEPDLDEGP